MKEQLREHIISLLSDLVTLDSQIILLAVLLVVSVIVIDSISSFAKKRSQEAGVSANTETVSVDGSDTMPIKEYISDMQGLAGKPDALIVENGFIIPVERKPLSKKLRDRHIAQLLVYMRLIEEFEGKRPPYGYLLLGPNCRRIKISNTEARQEWLQKMIDQMRACLEEHKPVPAAPHARKCARCNVRKSCGQRADLQVDSAPEVPVRINKKKSRAA